MRAVWLVVPVLLVIAASCARLGLVSPPDPIYRGLAESFTDYDASVLTGTTIVIDPGHGGKFAGALGRKGTREADVNLGVALELARMLKNCGATVIMTRTGDQDLLGTEEPPDARRDLEERVKLANAARADLFISVHHNSTAAPNPGYNAIETYYRMGDAGPSLDAARAIHRHLVKNLAIPEQSLIPGNYFVLRENENPAVLGEASYLSEKNMEKKLRSHEKQLLEARAYLFGLIDYFSRGLPHVAFTNVTPGGTVYSAFPLLAVRLDPGKGGGGVDHSSIRVCLDAEDAAWSFDAADSLLTIVAPRPLPSGEHTLEVSFTNLSGNSSRNTILDFVNVTEPAAILIRVSPARIHGSARTPFLLEAHVFDAYGNPARDGTTVRVQIQQGLEGENETFTRDGSACFYLTAKWPGTHSVKVTAGAVTQDAVLTAYRDSAIPLALRFVDAALGTPLDGVKVSVDGGEPRFTNRDGYVFTEGLGKGQHAVEAVLTGYISLQSPTRNDDWGPGGGERVFMMRALHAGAFFGKTFVIDPEDGIDEAPLMSPGGTRPRDLNLKVARSLRDYLARTGARVYLTREGDESVTPSARISLANGVDADFYIAVRHAVSERGGIPAYVSHYGTSGSGKALAESIVGEWSQVFGAGPRVREEYSFILRHTPCPAVAVMCLDLGSPGGEEEANRGTYGMREAYAIFSGVAAHLIPEDAESLGTLVGKVQGASKGGPPCILRLDGWLTVPCDGEGDFVVTSLAAGEHTIELVNPPSLRKSWNIDTSQPGASPLLLTP
jgi:N-acetylmuramoyl-L-alanine amidase